MFKKSEQTQVQCAPKNIKDIFKPATELPINDGLKLGVYARSKKGKSRLCWTAAELKDDNHTGDVYILDTESNAKKERHRWPVDVQQRVFIAEALKMAIIPDIDNPGKTKEVFDLVASLDAAMEAIDTLSEVLRTSPTKGTMCIDSCTDIWKWLGMWVDESAEIKHTAKGAVPRFEWGKANKRYMDFIYNLLTSGWHVILTFRAHPAVNEKGEDLKYDVAKMQKDTDFWVDAWVELRRDDGINYTATFRGDRFGGITDTIQNPTFSSIKSHLEKKTGVKIL